MHKKSWTYEKCKEAALEFNYRSEFKNAYPSAYSACLRNGWHNELCSHMVYKTKPSGYWTIELSLQEAKKYSSKVSFQKNSSRAYTVLYENNLLSNGCEHMHSPKEYSYLRFSYSIEFPLVNMVYVGITYNLTERKNKHFQKNNGQSKHKNQRIRELINKGIKYNWKPNPNPFHIKEAEEKEAELFNKYQNNDWIMLNIGKLGSTGAKPTKTKHECHLDALKFSTRQSFSRQSNSSYKIASRHGWLDEICSHMEEIIKPKGYWTFEKCKQEAIKFNSRMEFKDNNSSAYSIAVNNKWIDRICSHMSEDSKPDGYWALKKCIETAKKYEFRNEFRKNESSAYSIIKKNKWLELACSHLKGTTKPNGYWNSYGNCKNEASKYKTRTEYRIKARGSYAQANKNGWLDDFFK